MSKRYGLLNMNTKKTTLSTLIVIMLVLGTVLIPAVSAKNTSKEKNQESNIILDKDEIDISKLSTDEIRELAKTNESVRKLVEEDMKIQLVNIESFEDISCLPDNYPEDLKNQSITQMKSDQLANSDISTRSTINVYVWIVADEEYRSYFGDDWQSKAYNTIEGADDAFYSDHDINFIVQKYSEWDSSYTTDTLELMAEAQSEMGWDSNQQGCDMMAIFTNQYIDHWGRAESINYYGGDAWIMKHQGTASTDWHLAQHEASHNYGCPDHGYVTSPTCIMTYTYMFLTDDWCSTCDSTIETNRNHL